MYILTPWILTILQTSMLTVQTRLLHNFWKTHRSFWARCRLFFGKQDLSWIAAILQDSTPSVLIHLLHTFKFSSVWLHGAGLSEHYIAPCQVSQGLDLSDNSTLWCVMRLLASTPDPTMVAVLQTSPQYPEIVMDTLGFEPRAFRMRSGSDTLHHVPLKKIMLRPV